MIASKYCHEGSGWSGVGRGLDQGWPRARWEEGTTPAVGRRSGRGVQGGPEVAWGRDKDEVRKDRYGSALGVMGSRMLFSVFLPIRSCFLCISSSSRSLSSVSK